jgi:hypothetical protein
MKFSVVLESSSAEVSALLNKEFKYTRIVIDRWFDRYTLLVLNALTKAKLVRRSENPLPQPLLLLLRSVPPLDRVGRGTWLLTLLPSRPPGFRWWSWCPTSSRLVGPWLRVVSSFDWGSCVQSVQLGYTRSKRHGGSVGTSGVSVGRLGLGDVHLVDVPLFVLHLDRPSLGVSIPPVVVLVSTCTVCVDIHRDRGVVQVSWHVGGVIPSDVWAVGLLVGGVRLCEPVPS